MKTKLIAFIAIFLLYPFQSFTQVPDSNATVKQWLDYIYAQFNNLALHLELFQDNNGKYKTIILSGINYQAQQSIL